MLTIIYGQDLVKSRNLLDQIKKENTGKEIINLDGKKLDQTALKESLESGSMFGGDRLVILEDLTSNRSKKTVEEITDYLSLRHYSNNLILWEKKELTKTFLTKLKADKFFEFKLEAVIFKLLDALRPDNQNQLLTLLLQSIKVEKAELILYMLAGRIRHLILLKDNVEDAEEVLKMAPWQKGKLTKQANYFTLDNLVRLYRTLLQIEVEQKTGQNVFDLKKSLELLITNI